MRFNRRIRFNIKFDTYLAILRYRALSKDMLFVEQQLYVRHRTAEGLTIGSRQINDLIECVEDEEERIN